MPNIVAVTLKGTGAGNDKVFVPVSTQNSTGSALLESRADGSRMKTLTLTTFARLVKGGHFNTGYTVTEPVIRAVAGVDTAVGFMRKRVVYEYSGSATDAEIAQFFARTSHAEHATDQANFLVQILRDRLAPT